MKNHINFDHIGLEQLVIDQEQNKKVSILAKNKEIPAIIKGETGTGKEELAKLVHQRRQHLEGNIPLVSVNCAHLNNELALSILFGHVKGSFSGADRNTQGLIEHANGGILFLDEIHTLSFETQRRLLRVLNDGSYYRLGDTKVQFSHFQVVVASTKDLDDEVEQNYFLLDLRSRLTGIEINLKPLRQRLAEIPAFIDIFYQQQHFSLEAAQHQQLINKCQEFYWQGNIRQLFSVLNAWVALCDGQLSIDSFPYYKSMLAPKMIHSPQHYDQYIDEIIQAVEQAIQLDLPLSDAMDKIERYILKQALSANHRITDVYKGLKISRNNLYVKRRKYQLDQLSSHEFNHQVA